MLALLVWTGHDPGLRSSSRSSFISGCGQAFGGPAYQALIPSLVPRRDLPNAIALNSTQFNLLARARPGRGPPCSFDDSARGLVLRRERVVDSSSSCVCADGACTCPLTRASTDRRRARCCALKGGLCTTCADNRLMMTLTILVGVSTFLAMPILTMLPAFARKC
jgi:hypothetical protein